MWARLILPDCVGCDARKAASWITKLCVMCTAEEELHIQELERLLELDSYDG